MLHNRYIKLIIILLAVFTVSYFGGRNYVLNKLLHRLTAKAEQNFRLKTEYSKAGFVGFKTLYISNLTLVSETNDTIISVDSLLATPKLLPLLFGRKRLSKLFVNNANASFNVQLLRQFKNRFKTSPIDTTIQPKTASYANILNSMQGLLFRVFPNEITILNSGITYKRDNIFASVYCENFSYYKSKFIGNLLLSDNSFTERCMVQGVLDNSNRDITATVNHSNTDIVKLPYIGPRWHALFGFDTVHFSANFEEIDDNNLNIKGIASATHLTLQHKRIGIDSMVTDYAQIDFDFHVGAKFIELDSISQVHINKFSFSPYAKFEKDTAKKLTLGFMYKEFDANELFESLPRGFFTNFDGIKTEGRLAYQMFTSVDFSLPDSVKFVSKLENKGFKIRKYGVTDFRVMNGAFVQEVFDNDRFVKSILVSPNNPDFVPLNQISNYLKSCILTAEDGDFFYHRGFNERAFRESIATNLKEHRFARGGSTISMQLVKNVFLSRNKTISRKVEEALIVWLIENQRLTSKERMFEVYLNIIEWAPGIYGIKPASKFYFNKLPSALTLSESIYLSSLVPRPKAFRYTFVTNGVLRDYFKGYYKLLSSIMLRRNQITPTDTINLSPNIQLVGDAKNFLAKPDTIAVEDSLYFANPIPEPI